MNKEEKAPVIAGLELEKKATKRSINRIIYLDVDFIHYLFSQRL